MWCTLGAMWFGLYCSKSVIFFQWPTIRAFRATFPSRAVGWINLVKSRVSLVGGLPFPHALQLEELHTLLRHDKNGIVLAGSICNALDS